jgi:alanine racemase
LKKNSSFLIVGKECKVIGNITMDSFILDITNIKKIKLKEESYVNLIDNSNLKYILRNLEIISYEFLTLIGNRIVRRYN